MTDPATFTKPATFLVVIDRTISDTGSRLQLAKETAQAMVAAVAAMQETGLSNVRVYSIARSEKGLEILLQADRPELPGAVTNDDPTVPGPPP